VKWAIVALAACGPPRANLVHDVERPAITEALAAPVVFGPVVQPAAIYNEPVAAESTPLADAVFAGLVELAREKGQPEREPRLDRVAADLAELAGRGGELDEAVVEFALRARGVVEPAARIAVSRAGDAETMLAELGPKLADSLFFGNVRVGIGGTNPTLVLVVHSSLATLAPTTPRMLEARGEVTLQAALDASLHAPHVTITHEDNSVEHPKILKVNPWTFQAPFQCNEHTGEQWVLIEACDAKNTLLRLALFPIACGTQLATSYRVEPRTNTATRDVERRLASIINRERSAARLPALLGDLRADATARDMATAMQRSGRIDHELGGTTPQRLLADNLIPPYAYELTLHAPDLAAAAEILMNEPSYRRIVAQDDVSHLGLAIARDAHGELYIAIELVRIVPRIDTVAMRVEILRRLQARMPEHVKLPISPLLERLAKKYVTGRAQGWSEQTMMAVIQKDPEFVFGPFGTMKRAMTLLITDDVDKVDLGPNPAPDGVGVAVVQAPREGALVGRTWVLILYAHNRD
jgi:uncharacterized protein YkwD